MPLVFYALQRKWTTPSSRPFFLGEGYVPDRLMRELEGGAKCCGNFSTGAEKEGKGSASVGERDLERGYGGQSNNSGGGGLTFIVTAHVQGKLVSPSGRKVRERVMKPIEMVAAMGHRCDRCGSASPLPGAAVPASPDPIPTTGGEFCDSGEAAKPANDRLSASSSSIQTEDEEPLPAEASVWDDVRGRMSVDVKQWV